MRIAVTRKSWTLFVSEGELMPAEENLTVFGP